MEQQTKRYISQRSYQGIKIHCSVTKMEKGEVTTEKSTRLSGPELETNVL